MEVKSENEVVWSEQGGDKRFLYYIQQLPVATAILKGTDYVVEVANAKMLELWGKTAEQVLNRPVFEGIPEVQGQGLEELLENVYTKGEKYEAHERPVILERNGKLETTYINFVYEPFKEVDGTITGVLAVATEVTQQVRARITVEESYIFNQTVLESSPDCVKILDLEGTLTYINQNGVCILEGDSKETFLNRKWETMWGQENQPMVLDAIAKAIGGETAQFTALSPTLKNTPKWWDVIVIPISNAEGNVISLLASSRDITERSAAAKQIVESAERFNHLIYSSPSAIGILNGENLIITIAKDAILEIWGKGKEIIGKPYFEALPELAEQRYREVFANVFNTGVPFNAIETPVKMMQNGVMTLKYYNFLLHPQKNIEGDIDGIGIIATEVTSQALLNHKVKQSEEKFAAAVEAVKGIVWTNNERGEMEDEQLGWAELTGQQRSEYKGYGWTNAIHPEDIQPTVAAWQEAVAEVKTFNFEHRVKVRDGSWRAFSIKAIPLKNDDGTPREWVGVHTDIEQQKTFAYELKKQVQERTKELALKNLELERINKELQSFAYISSHDLQEPLRKIQTFATRLLDTENENLSNKGKEMFSRMQNSASRMQALIDDLLAYSRTSIVERNYETTALSDLVAEVKADLKEDLIQKGATIEANNLCEVYVIPFQFRQLLQNIVSNSLKYSHPQRSPHITITCTLGKGSDFNIEKLDDHKKYCLISISDNGIGFEQQFSNKIFELFQRLHGRAEYIGTGIGLAIVKKIVENHNGLILAKGVLGEGATFEIYIPQ
ncbi:hypothetical protein BH09BAC1_BH09BAC1_04280 [soil metagenome]